MGNFILSLAQARVMVHGLGSSPAAISVMLPSRTRKKKIMTICITDWLIWACLVALIAMVIVTYTFD
jgi:hypothetical protein